jgi:large subunit ribosomal protein L24
MAGLSVRKNDTVIVIAGRDRGKRGRVLRVVPDRRRVVVEGVNFVKRHTRPNPQRNIKGGIVEREAALAVANVQIVCPECGAPARVGRRRLDDGSRVRVCRKCDGVIDK